MIFGILYLGYALRPITIPMLLALLFAYLFEPLVERMTRRRRVSRPGAAIMIIASFFLVVMVPLGLGLGLGVVQGVRLVHNVASNTSRLVDVVVNPDDQVRAQIVKTLPPQLEQAGQAAHQVPQAHHRRARQVGRGQANPRPSKAQAPPHRAAPGISPDDPGCRVRPAAPTR